MKSNGNVIVNKPRENDWRDVSNMSDKNITKDIKNFQKKSSASSLGIRRFFFKKINHVDHVVMHIKRGKKRIYAT